MLELLGGRKFIVFTALLISAYVNAAGFELDLDFVRNAAIIYIGAEGVADAIGRYKDN